MNSVLFATPVAAMPEPHSVHVSVLHDEVLHWLAPRPGQVLVDGTLGGGGHARALAERVKPDGLVLGLDRDPAAVRRVRDEAGHPNLKPLWANYRDLPLVLAELSIPAVDGLLLDLGLSSDQLADSMRGFSFTATGPLDLRFDPTEGHSAVELLASIDEKALADLIFRYGEERYSRRIARAIVERRQWQPIATADDLADLVRRVVPGSRHQRIDPATRTFQALRISVNDELGALEALLERLPDCLRVGGRVAIISFHSLEDRIVKLAFRHDARWQVLTRKPIESTAAERMRNPRCRSARLRVAQRSENTSA